MAKLNFESEQNFYILFEQLKALFPNASLFLADTTTQAIHYKFNLCTRQISQNPYPIRVLPS
ncbi:hypothetical protein HPJ34_09510 [Acinetobacter baumannii]|nr:hypothetical protein [Acinetobacter baumannii]